MVWKTVTAPSLLTTVIGAALAATAYLTGDGRRCKRPIVNRFSWRTCQFLEIDADDAYDNGWFKRELRCSKATFNIIVQKIRLKWNDVNSPLHIRTIFTIRERVALALYHLASSGTYSRSGLMFGISKSRAMLYVDQVLQVLIRCYEKTTIYLVWYTWYLVLQNI